MKVRCINDDWSDVPIGSVAHAVLTVGDPMPVKGEIYEVIGTSWVEKEKVAYELAEFDYSNYPGGRLLFKKERFEIVDDSFVPNAVRNIAGMGETLVREERMYISFNFDLPKPKRIPRKKKKLNKKFIRIQTFTHNG